MNSSHFPDERLAAWLAGDLDDAESSAVEAALRDDPDLAARADAIADTVGRLRRLDAVAVPDGFAARLDARLDEERAAGADDAVPSLARARRARSGRFAAIGTVAATVVLLVGVGITALGGQGDDEDPSTVAQFDRQQTVRESGAAEEDAAAPESAAEPTDDDLRTMMDAPDEAAGDTMDTAESGDTETADEDDADSGFSGAGPETRDEGAAVDDAAAARARYGDEPLALALLGTPVAEAEQMAMANRVALAREDDLRPSGLAPSACLHALDESSTGVAVVVLVEAVTVDGDAGLMHLVVATEEDGTELDRVLAVVLDPDGCGVRFLATVATGS